MSMDVLVLLCVKDDIHWIKLLIGQSTGQISRAAKSHKGACLGVELHPSLPSGQPVRESIIASFLLAFYEVLNNRREANDCLWYWD